MIMDKRLLILPLTAIVMLGGCVTVPSGPTVMVLPGPQKAFDQFQNDAMACQQFAQGVVAPAGQAAANNAAASAAVGTALGENPWPLLIPCHRIVAASGKMTGFSGPGGVATKARLLALEGAQLL